MILYLPRCRIYFQVVGGFLLRLSIYRSTNRESMSQTQKRCLRWSYISMRLLLTYHMMEQLEIFPKRHVCPHWNPEKARDLQQRVHTLKFLAEWCDYDISASMTAHRAKALDFFHFLNSPQQRSCCHWPLHINSCPTTSLPLFLGLIVELILILRSIDLWCHILLLVAT